MPDQLLFYYDGCLSGRCVCRTLTEALLAQRLTSSAENGEYERQRIKEVVDEAMRLFAESDIFSRSTHLPNDESARDESGTRNRCKALAVRSGSDRKNGVGVGECSVRRRA